MSNVIQFRGKRINHIKRQQQGMRTRYPWEVHQALNHLDQALMYIMEFEDERWKTMAKEIHSILVRGEVIEQELTNKER